MKDVPLSSAETMFDTIVVVGLGLIGGSFSLEVKQHQLARNLIGYDQNPTHCQEAEQLGLVHQAFSEWNDSLTKADLLLLAVPVGAIPMVAEQIRPWLRPQTIVTDVGSVKQPILELMSQGAYRDLHFVGGHPIAGAETFGPSSARVGLFANKTFILTPTADTDSPSLQRIHDLWSAIGSNVLEMEAHQHDFVFAEVSHLPHLLAYSSMETIGKTGSPEILGYSGAGLKDFSRIAASSPEMWADIFLANQSHLLQSIQRFQQTLDEMENAIRHQDRSALIEHLTHSKKLKDDWIA